MGLLFNKIIPMDMLARLPRPFVHRLRDIRIKQLEDQNREQERMMKQQEQKMGNARNALPAVSPSSIGGASFEDIIDELT